MCWKVRMGEEMVCVLQLLELFIVLFLMCMIVVCFFIEVLFSLRIMVVCEVLFRISEFLVNVRNKMSRSSVSWVRICLIWEDVLVFCVLC